MKRCYDNYWKGKFQDYNHCGTSVKGKDDYATFEECTYPATCCHMHAIANHMLLRGEY